MGVGVNLLRSILRLPLHIFVIQDTKIPPMSLRYGFMCLGLAKANPQHMGLADQGSLRTAIYQYISLQTSIRLNASIASLTYPLVYPLSQKSATYSMQAYSILTTRSSQVNNILGFKHIQNRSDKDSIVDSNLPLPSHRDCLGMKKNWRTGGC